jgi:hypothetical protein
VGWYGLDWCVSGYGQVEDIVKALMNIWVLENARKFSSGCTTDGLSSSAQLHRANLLLIS